MSETAVEPLGQQPDPLEEARDAVSEPFTDVYHNPRESSSRMGLEARAYAYRAGASLAFGMGNMVSPAVPSPHMTVYLDSTFSKQYSGKDKIRAYVWTPDRPRMGSRKGSKESADPRSRRPAVINFHGGGFVLGQGTDDGRWAMAVMQALGAVVFSVEYRLAPGYPFPTPVEDCADAVLQIWRRADEFWIDRDRIMVSGFSAGGTLALASWVLLADYKRWGYEIKPDPDLAKGMSELSVDDTGDDDTSAKGQDGKADPKVPQLAGLMLFYPLLDWTQSRPRKRLTCSKPEFTLSRTLTDLFDASYLYPYEEVKSQLDNPLLSPGLMPDDLLDRLPPVQLCLCEYDMLLAEGRRFYERLQARKKESGAREVEKAKHAWDKPSGLLYSPPESMGIEYGEAVRVMAGWIGREEGNGSGEDLSQREREREEQGNLRHPEA
ncbi:alpha/beta-hydrolase [Cryphonectria parasitica EP155]|uniref:Alpha/beta-hydrolase n=1 Tax=Cryphonectria parasitica (strain ATCC 38755 / EP155) TaxID=660469 RepID=A0A9P4XYI5_CRYP1|nr:alpha/beta-hydrolase [Cryphonectria parasitica EP155]KAF3763122.1 alpha/beta-hydrolase [Cryphonectria parasitica EP155]